jgi:hypothetical protein
MLGCPVRFMDATYGSRAMLGYPYMTSMYPTGHSSIALDPYMMSMSSSVCAHPRITFKKPLWQALSLGTLGCPWSPP